MTRDRSDETPAYCVGGAAPGPAHVFDWPQEPTEGSKPVLRFPHNEAALAQCGINIDWIGSDEILFVNNLPDVGILRGATPVIVTDSSAFERRTAIVATLGSAREPYRAMSPALAVNSLTEWSSVR